MKARVCLRYFVNDCNGYYMEPLHTSNTKTKKMKKAILYNQIVLLQNIQIKSYSKHCVKSVEIRSFFWSVISRIRTEFGSVFSPNAGKYGPKKTPYLDTFQTVQ